VPEIETTPAERLVHELGNLMAVTLAQAEYLQHGHATPKDRRESLESIRQSALQARETVRQLHRIVRAGRPGAGPAVGDRPAPGEVASPRGRTPPASVLVVDDDEEVRDSLAALLAQLGHDVETAASGVEGVERYRRRRFSCVVTDMAMPGLSGLMVSRAIKDHDPGAYVVLLTGVEHEGDPREFQAAGVDRVMVKPLSRDEIRWLVDRDARRRAQGAP
jgi:CheY-like chemotaxis protein